MHAQGADVPIGTALAQVALRKTEACHRSPNMAEPIGVRDSNTTDPPITNLGTNSSEAASANSTKKQEGEQQKGSCSHKSLCLPTGVPAHRRSKTTTPSTHSQGPLTRCQTTQITTPPLDAAPSPRLQEVGNPGTPHDHRLARTVRVRMGPSTTPAQVAGPLEPPPPTVWSG